MKEKSCGAIIVKDNEVLLIKSKNGIVNFPKGHVEKSETEVETAIREVKEETNLDIEIISKYRYENKYLMENGIDKEVIFFLAIPKSLDIVKQESEISEIFWCEIDNVASMLMYENQQILWSKAIKDIKSI